MWFSVLCCVCFELFSCCLLLPHRIDFSVNYQTICFCRPLNTVCCSVHHPSSIKISENILEAAMLAQSITLSPPCFTHQLLCSGSAFQHVDRGSRTFLSLYFFISYNLVRSSLHLEVFCTMILLGKTRNFAL